MREGIFGSTTSLFSPLFGCIVLLLFSTTSLAGAQTTAPSLGLFQNHADIGTVMRPGSAQYDASTQGYTLTGSGENIWFTSDAFQFAGKPMSAVNATSPETCFHAKGGNSHRKAVLMFRQSLDAD